MEQDLEQKKPGSAREWFARFFKFFAFSCGAGVIQVVSIVLLNEVFDVKHSLSYVIGLTLSVLYNFTVNRRYTFRSAKNVPIAMLLVFAFNVPFGWYTYWLTDYLEGLGLYVYLVTLICMVQNVILEYLWFRYIVFRGSMDTNDIAKKKQGQIAAEEGEPPDISAL